MLVDLLTYRTTGVVLVDLLTYRTTGTGTVPGTGTTGTGTGPEGTRGCGPLEGTGGPAAQGYGAAVPSAQTVREGTEGSGRVRTRVQRVRGYEKRVLGYWAVPLKFGRGL